MILSVHQPQYIPWLGYFDKIDKSGCFVFLDNVQYKAREYQNRNKIVTDKGWIWLTVPVIIKGQAVQKIRDVKINDSFNWQRKHAKTLENFYNKAPFFKNYVSFLGSVYSSSWEKLADLNIHVIKYLLAEFKINTPLYYESELNISSRKTDRIIDICKKLNADTYLSGIGGRDYLEEDKFIKAGIKLEYQNFNHPVYCQCYMKGEESFLPNMSAVDLLFNEGEKSIDILRGKFKPTWGKR